MIRGQDVREGMWAHDCSNHRRFEFEKKETDMGDIEFWRNQHSLQQQTAQDYKDLAQEYKVLMLAYKKMYYEDCCVHEMHEEEMRGFNKSKFFCSKCDKEMQTPK